MQPEHTGPDGGMHPTADDDLLVLDDSEADPYMHAALSLARCPNPVGGLAVVIGHLLALTSVDRQRLALLGIDDESADALEQAFDVNNNIDELIEDLATAAAKRRYRSDLRSIAMDLGIRQGSHSYATLQRNLTAFAADNDVDDLTIAFRLMRAERPDLLPRTPDKPANSETPS